MNRRDHDETPPGAIDREDLIREATGLTERLEVVVEDEHDPWVVGRRENGAMSLFAGLSLVIQFNQANELRRAYYKGDRIKSQGRRLIRLHRDPSRGKVSFVEAPLEVHERDSLLRDAASAMTKLTAALADRSSVRRIVSPDSDQFSETVVRWARDMLQSPLVIAERPHA